MEEELEALRANQTWDVAPCPAMVTPIGCKWIFYVKLKFVVCWTNIRLDFFLWATNKNMESTMTRHLLL